MGQGPEGLPGAGGPAGSRDVAGVLETIASTVGKTPDALAVTVASRTSPWATLVATLVSLRARDEQTAVAAPRILAVAPTPEAMSAMPEERVWEAIYPISFHRTKARTLIGVARQILQEHGGTVPDTVDGLLSLKGVGRKSANLVLTLGFGKDAICVDTHVHRISNRLGFVKTDRPHRTEEELEKVLPREWWIPVNGTLIAFGRTVCLPISPKCSSCPVRDSCPREGVGRSR